MKGKSNLWKGLGITGVVLLVSATVVASGFTRSTGRADCPGKLICSVTGEEVCKDQCPLVDPNRADCPGKIECPLTGELVCRDECPLGMVSEADSDLPPCCRGKK